MPAGSELRRRHLPRGGCRGGGHGGRDLGRLGHRLQRCARRACTRWACCAEGGTLIGFIWPAQNPELMQALAARKCHGAGHRLAAAAAEPRAEDGRADLDGRGQRLSRGHRGGQRLRPLLQWPGHSRGQRSRRPRCSSPRRRGQPAAIGTNLAWARSCAPTTPAPSRRPVVSLGGEFVKVDYEEEGSGGGYAKVMSEGFQAAQRDVLRNRPRGPTSSSPPR